LTLGGLAADDWSVEKHDLARNHHFRGFEICAGAAIADSPRMQVPETNFEVKVDSLVWNPVHFNDFFDQLVQEAALARPA
jgi:hypothetical protein